MYVFESGGLAGWLGIVSAVLAAIAFVPYVADTIVGRTRPQRSSWMIWTVLSVVSFFSQAYEGATDSLMFAGVMTAGSLTIFLLSIRRGVGGFAHRQDAWLLAAAALGLVLWYTTETAVYALALAISISLLGGVMTVTKTYRDPYSETMPKWLLSLLAAVLAAFSVGEVNYVLLAYPVYLVVLNIAIIAATLAGRERRMA